MKSVNRTEEGGEGKADEYITKYTEDIEKLKETRGRWEARIAQIDEKLASRDTDNSLQKYQDFRDLIVCVEQLFESAKDRIFDTELGIVICWSAKQPPKVRSLIAFKFKGNLTSVKLMQP